MKLSQCKAEININRFDVPDCECVILLRPTKSLTLYIQQSMRAMRYKKSKTAIIIDHVGNIFEHGFPDDKREWSLKTKKRNKGPDIKLKVCDGCYACLPLNTKICPECEYEFTVDDGNNEEETVVDAELVQIERKNMLKLVKYTYYKRLSTFEEMREFQQAKGYKFMWVIHKCLEQKIEIPEKYHYMIRRYVANDGA